MKIRMATAEDIQDVLSRTTSRVMKEAPAEWDLLFTCELDSGPIAAVGGFRFLTAHSAVGWYSLTPEGHAAPKELLRAAKAWLSEVAKTYGLRVVFGFVDADYPEAIRFVEHLGYKRVCKIPNMREDGKVAIQYMRTF
jgi:L-amino acid N-acyltransferase YncA